MKILAKNKKAYFDYEILDQFEAGIILAGWEVKSIKDGRASLKESLVSIRQGEAFLLNMHVSKWPGMAEKRKNIEVQERKLLLHKAQINKLMKGISIKGNTIVPLDIHLSKNRVKLNIALVRGKKQYDKRKQLKERDQKRAIQRDLKSIGY